MTPNPVQSQLNEIIAGTRELVLDICDDTGYAVGKMRPLTLAHLDNQEVVQKLTDWRNQNMHCFLSQFVATVERTRSWLEHVVFKIPGQMMFLISNTEQMVGHVGFKNLTMHDAMLDNAIRGERGGHPKLLVWAHRVLANWLFWEAGIGNLYGYVMADNAPAIMMNRQIGWGGWVRFPLFEESRGSDVHWTFGETNQTSPSGKYCYKIILDKEEMLKNL